MRQTQGAPPEPRILSQGWFYHYRDREQGPMGLADLRDALRLLPHADVLVWHPSLPEWVGANDERVVDLFAAPPSPVAPMGLLAVLFSFKGRIERLRYLRGSCLLLVPGFSLAYFAQALSKTSLGPDGAQILHVVLLLPLFWIGSALIAKRLHDIDLSAGHLVWLVPVTTAANLVTGEPAQSIAVFASALVGLWLLLKRGVRGGNRYGSDPIGGVASPGLPHTPSSRGRVSGVLFVLLILVGAGALLAYGGRALDTVRSSPSLCSDPRVLATLHDLVGKDPGLIIIGAYYGSFANIRISFHGVRTLDSDNPARGSTCAASMHISAIDKSKANIGDQDLSDVGYTVQYIDGSSTEYVVNVVR